MLEQFEVAASSSPLQPDDAVPVPWLPGFIPFAEGSTVDGPYKGAIPGSYLLEMRDYHPDIVAKSLTIPMLILQGGYDFEVTEKDDFAIWMKSLRSEKRVTFRLYPKLTHAFTTTSGPPIFPIYAYAPGRNVEEKVVADIASWIGSL